MNMTWLLRWSLGLVIMVLFFVLLAALVMGCAPRPQQHMWPCIYVERGGDTVQVAYCGVTTQEAE